MYPYFRMAKEMWKHRSSDKLAPAEPHISYHICWPQDLDAWMELNNGRTLTLMDLGRIPLISRCGITGVMTRKGWRMTVAGNTLRYRKRVVPFQRLEMRSRLLGWDRRFFYIEQSTWQPDGECANHALYRSAVTGPDGIVAPSEVMHELGYETSLDLPEWVNAWIEADAQRPWPPKH
jgi:acyl-CoA thioesterase FadM